MANLVLIEEPAKSINYIRFATLLNVFRGCVYCTMFSPSSLKEVLFKFFKLDTLAETLSGYVEARLDLLKLEIREDVAKAFAQALVFGVIVFFVLLFIIFFSIGLALFLNRYFIDSYAGFWTVAGIYLTLSGLLFIFKKQLFQNLGRFLKERLKHKQ